mgnify:FL=1
MTRWTVEDPAGFIHTVGYDHNGIWHGTENLAQHMHTKHQWERSYMTRNLLNSILTDINGGDWNGYTWIKL